MAVSTMSPLSAEKAGLELTVSQDTTQTIIIRKKIVFFMQHLLVIMLINILNLLDLTATMGI